MDANGYADLSRRVARLETQLRWWRLVTAGLVAFVAWFAGDLAHVVGRHGETLTTRKLVLVDRAGVERAWFGLADDDTPHIEFYDARGEDLAGLGLLPDDRLEVEIREGTPLLLPH